MSTAHLAFFLPSLAAGGAERVVLAIAGELARRGYRCTLLLAQGGGRWESRVPANVECIALGARKPLSAVPALARWLARERPEALLSTVFAANLAALLAARLARSRSRIVIREAFFVAEDVMTRSALGTHLNRFAMHRLYPRADAVIALSTGLAQHVQRTAGIAAARVHVIPNPRLPAPAAPPGVREPDLIVACGRLEAQKDFASLLRAVASLSPPARVVILGEGSRREELERLADALGIAARTAFPGYCADPTAWMRRAHVFCSSSRLEGFPNALLEALDANCHVVATDSSDAVSEILQHGERGTLVPVGDVDALAGALGDALAHPAPTPRPDGRFGLSGIADAYLNVLLPQSS